MTSSETGCSILCGFFGASSTFAFIFAAFAAANRCLFCYTSAMNCLYRTMTSSETGLSILFGVVSNRTALTGFFIVGSVCIFSGNFLKCGLACTNLLSSSILSLSMRDGGTLLICTNSIVFISMSSCFTGSSSPRRLQYSSIS